MKTGRITKCSYLFLVLLYYCSIIHHCRYDPADINRVKSVFHVHHWVFQGIVGVVQDFKTDVHHEVFKLRERKHERGTVGERERLLNLFETDFKLFCVSVTPPLVCLAAIYLSVFALPLSCEGTSPCLCGLVTFWHLLSTSFLHSTNRVPDAAEAHEPSRSHCCDNSQRWPKTHILLTLSHSLCVCYLSIIPGNTSDVVPGPLVNHSIFIHYVLLEETLIGEVHHIIWHAHKDTVMSIFCPHANGVTQIKLLCVLPLHQGLKSMWKVTLSILSTVCLSCDSSNTARW